MIDAQYLCIYYARRRVHELQAINMKARKNTARKATNLSLDAYLLQEAKILGINISRSAEAGIADAVRKSRREQWLRENAAALESSNAYVDNHGLPLARYRQF
jgi:Post-segregation antitoxin (ccd killing mechanism protein) encoded by the F plasmid